MYKTILSIAAAALMAGGAEAKSRDPGPPDGRQAATGAFDRIAVAGPFLVRVSTGNVPSVSLVGPRTMLDDTELLVRDGQLIIRWQEGASWSRNGGQGVDIDIKVPNLREATMAGAGSIAIDAVQGDSFDAVLLGAGGVQFGQFLRGVAAPLAPPLLLAQQFLGLLRVALVQLHLALVGAFVGRGHRRDVRARLDHVLLGGDGDQTVRNGR